MPEQGEVSMEEFRQMAERAGLGLTEQDLEDVKPIYELYAAYAAQLHDINLGAEEMVVQFHPDWPRS